MRRGIFAKTAVLLVVLAMAATACQRKTPTGDPTQGGEEAKSLLETVRERGTVKCGVNDSVPGFGFIPEGGSEPEGFDIDFCRAIAAAVLGDESKHELVVVTADERFNQLRSGNYDVLVRNTTWTSSRDGSEGVAFAHVNFYDGQAMMVRAGEYKAVKDMDGTTVCVTAGTTTELNLADYAGELGIKIEALTFETNDEILAAFKAERCQGWTSDSSQLAGLKAQFESDLGALEVLPDIMSKEPLAPAVLDGDADWYDAVNWVVTGLISAEECGITQDNVDQLLADPPTPQCGNLLGAEVEDDTGAAAPFDAGLDLDPGFMVNAISAVGNYGEIFDRNVGAGSDLGLDRGLNALWTDGGLQYAPPFR